MHLSSVLSSVLVAALLPLATAVPSPRVVDSSDLVSRASTCNTPSNRACWTNGFDINTDYEASTPVTGVTRSYTLRITEHDNWRGPDGVVKQKVMLVNGQFPGPVLTADWGDRFSITVINELRDNGTSIHWHGIRQLNSNLHDGANGVTECPIPPGGRKVYSFLATQYGTSWYHSHFSAQYGNGVVGTIQINGPSSLNYDIDLGNLPLTDYYYATADDIVEFTKSNGPPAADNVLINGTNIHPTTGQGAYANITLTPGKRHRLRIINTSVETHFVVSAVGHSMTIIESDFVPVQAQTVDSVFLAVGHRYDVTIDANQPVGNYWLNVSFVASGACGRSVNPAPAAILRYAGAPAVKPVNPGTRPASFPTTCTDLDNLTPVVRRSVDVSGFRKTVGNTLPVTLDTSGTPLFVWKMNNSAIRVDWNKPVDQYVMEGNVSAIPRSDNIVRVEDRDKWTFWLIENDPGFPIPHPFHLHGHDFLMIGRSDPNNPNPPRFSESDVSNLRGNNPVRRDVVMLGSRGWLVIAFKTDNPGAWLLHCHIAWHVSGGLSVDFLERTDDMRQQFASNVDDTIAFRTNCRNWGNFYPSRAQFDMADSGL